MRKLKLPEDWIDISSLGVIINYAELTKLCKANGLNAGNVSYIIDRLVTNTHRMINEITDDEGQL